VLVHARVGTVPPLVRGGHEAVLHGEPRRLAPERGDLDAVHAAAPRVPLHEARLVRAIRRLQLEERTPGELAEVGELGLDVAQHVGWERAVQVLAQQRVRREGVPEPRGILEEGHGTEDSAAAGDVLRSWVAVGVGVPVAVATYARAPRRMATDPGTPGRSVTDSTSEMRWKIPSCPS
jgi:hypothetical protein